MGQKVHPKVFRLGVNKVWSSRWFANKRDFARFLEQDITIRKHIQKRFPEGGIAAIDVERSANTLTITVLTARPGVVIGRGGSGAEELKKALKRFILRDPKVTLKLNIQELTQPELNAQIVVQSMIDQIQKRIPFRRVLRQAVEHVMRAGAQGVRVRLSGRLNGAEIARTESLTNGSLPLQTLRSDIDYACGTAQTTYGAIGAKAWIYRGEVFTPKAEESAAAGGGKR